MVPCLCQLFTNKNTVHGGVRSKEDRYRMEYMDDFGFDPLRKRNNALGTTGIGGCNVQGVECRTERRKVADYETGVKSRVHINTV
jgi:hypothetical protein